MSIIHSATWSVPLERTSPVVGSYTSTPSSLTVTVALGLDDDVGLAEDREQVAGAGLLQFLAHQYCSATNADVPDPHVGSRTRSPGSVAMSRHR